MLWKLLVSLAALSSHHGHKNSERQEEFVPSPHRSQTLEEEGSATGRTPCTDLTGTWRNELGLVQPVSGGSLVAFNVLWNYGASLTAWVGQCLVCDGQEKLYTTWVLRSLQIPSKRWMSTIINQDTFWRVDEDSQDTAQNAKVKVQSSDILGNWKSVSGDTVKIIHASKKGSMEGLHKSADNVNGAPVFGRFDGNQTYIALGFVAANSQYIKGWTGHIYNPQDANQQIETSWLSHTFSDQCNDPRKHVEYGMDYYSKGGANAE